MLADLDRELAEIEADDPHADLVAWLDNLTPANFVNCELPEEAPRQRAESPLLQRFEGRQSTPVSTPPAVRPLDRDTTPPTQTSKTTPKASQNAKPNTTPQASTKTSQTPAKRRHLADEHSITAWREAMNGHVYAVDVRLAAEIAAKAMNQPEPLDWFRRRFARWVKPALGYVPAHVLAAGITSTGGDAFHVHAWVSVTDPSHMKAVEFALLLAAGKSSDPAFRKRQIKASLAKERIARHRDAYLAENASEARAANVPGKHIIASREIKSAATATRSASPKTASSRPKAQRLVINDLSPKYTADHAEKVLAEDSGLNHKPEVEASNPIERPTEDANHYDGPGVRSPGRGLGPRSVRPCAGSRRDRRPRRHPYRPGRAWRRHSRTSGGGGTDRRLTPPASAIGPP